MNHLKTIALGAALLLTATVESQAVIEAQAVSPCVPCPDPSAFKITNCAGGSCTAMIGTSQTSSFWLGMNQKGSTAKSGLTLLSNPTLSVPKDFPVCTYKTNQPGVLFDATNMYKKYTNKNNKCSYPAPKDTCKIDEFYCKP